MMDNDFNDMVKKLQRKIKTEEEQMYSPIVIKEYRNPTYFGMIESPDAFGHIIGPCGDSMKITLKINKGIIQKALFWTDGCGATLACGNMLMKMIVGKTINHAKTISDEQLLIALNGLPVKHRHCAELALTTLNESLNKLEESQHKRE
jgi:nitrogen fixation protein NifU and related proteins